MRDSRHFLALKSSDNMAISAKEGVDVQIAIGNEDDRKELLKVLSNS